MSLIRRKQYASIPGLSNKKKDKINAYTDRQTCIYANTHKVFVVIWVLVTKYGHWSFRLHGYAQEMTKKQKSKEKQQINYCREKRKLFLLVSCNHIFSIYSA